MPKSRKTKAKYKDFQKVKLKVGKKLPKADNVTNTSFKTRAIHIKEQLKSASTSEQPTTKRRQNLSDLLSHCHHYSVSVRLDAVTGMREIISENPLLLQTHLAAILDRISPLCLDKDGVVRAAVHRFFRAALPHVPANQISPFFRVLAAHLSCAMTHIDDDIRVDSLPLLDLCIEHYPHLVVTSSSNLLANFIEQISRQSSSGTSGSGSGAGAGGGLGHSGRSLLVNPTSKLSTQKWRVKVLDRLHRFLEAVVAYDEAAASGTFAPGTPTGAPFKVESSASDQIPNIRWDPNKAASYQPTGSYWPKDDQLYTINEPNKVTGVANAMSGTDVLSNRTKLSSLLNMLFPVLLQCWVEVGPAQMATDLPGNVLSAEALSTLANVLRVVLLLLRCAENHSHSNDGRLMQNVRDKYTSEFVQYFLPCFPYSMHEAAASDKKTKVARTSQLPESVLSLNLMVCEVMAHFVHIGAQGIPEWLSKLTAFNTGCTRTSLSSEQLQVLIRCTNKLLTSKLSSSDQEELLNSVCSIFHGRHSLSKDRLLLSNFITDYVFATKNSHCLRMPCITRWLTSLPPSLAQVCDKSHEVTSKMLDVLCRIAPLGQSSFLTALQDASLHLIDALQHLDEHLQGRMVELLVRVPKWTRLQLQGLATSCHKHHLHPTALNRLLLSILYRHHQERVAESVVLELGAFFSFTLSVVIGYEAKLLQQYSARDSNSSSPAARGAGLSLDMRTRWTRSAEYTKVICSVLKEFTNTQQVATLLSSAICDIIEQYVSLPLDSMHSLICVMAVLLRVSTGAFLSLPVGFVKASVVAAVEAVASPREEAQSPQAWSRLTREACLDRQADGESAKPLGSNDGRSAQVAGSGSERRCLLSSTDIKDAVLGACQDMLAESSELLLRFTSVLLRMMDGCENMETLLSHVLLFTALLRSPKLKHNMAVQTHQTQLVFSKLQEKMPDLQQQTWWSNLRYELSLLQPGRL